MTYFYSYGGRGHGPLDSPDPSGTAVFLQNADTWMFWIVCPRGPFGGEGGDPFSDASFAGERITRVDIRSGNIIDAWDSFARLPG